MTPDTSVLLSLLLSLQLDTNTLVQLVCVKKVICHLMTCHIHCRVFLALIDFQLFHLSDSAI